MTAPVWTFAAEHDVRTEIKDNIEDAKKKTTTRKSRKTTTKKDDVEKEDSDMPKVNLVYDKEDGKIYKYKVVREDWNGKLGKRDALSPD